MRFETNIGRWDLILMQARLYWVRGSPLLSFVLWTVVFAAIIFLTKGIPKTPWNWFALSVSGAGVGILTSVTLWLWSMALVFFSANEQNGAIGAHAFELRNDGLFERTAANETLTKWSAIKSVSRSSNAMYIEIAPGLFHLIPRAAFSTEAEFDACYNQLEHRTMKAR